ncbi:MAG: HNH endonuclease [Armatimonadota bacterium]
MPTAPKRPCAVKNCPNLTNKRFCEQHEREHWKRLDANRSNSAARGYDARWSKLAKLYLKRNPLCEDCQERGLTVAAQLVHHIKEVDTHPKLRLSWDNLRSLCRACHERTHGFDRR